MKKSLIISIIVTAIVVGGGAFYGGTLYQKSQTATATATATAAAGARGAYAGAGRTGASAGGLTTGSVLNKSGNSLSVESRDGSSKVVFVASSTSIGMMTAGTLDDVTTGANVIVTGTSNSDGSITATSIQIRPLTPPPSTAPATGATSTQ